jgi:hypothetical protein
MMTTEDQGEAAGRPQRKLANNTKSSRSRCDRSAEMKLVMEKLALPELSKSGDGIRSRRNAININRPALQAGL